MAKSNKASTNRQGASGKSQGSSKSGGRQGGEIDRMFEALGVSGSVASSGAAKGFDAEELLDKARNYVNTQMEAAKSYVAANPKAVYGTLAGVVLGAGLLTAAAVSKKKSSSAKKSSSKSAASKGGAKSSSRKSTGSSSKKSSGSKGSSKKSSSKSGR